MATDGVRGESERKDMSDDIVDLLLVTIPIEASQQEYLTFEQVVMRDAADEIKRLRAEVEHYKTLYYKQAMEADCES